MPRALRLSSLPALLLALASCTTNGGNTFLVSTRIVLPSGYDATTNTCTSRTFKPEAAEAIYANFGTDNPLTMGLVLDNRLSTTVAGAHDQSNDFTGTALVIKYESAGSGVISIPERTVSAQGYVPATAKAAVVADVVSTTDAATLKGQMGTDLYVRVNIHAVGYLNDGHKVQSSDYSFLVKAAAKTDLCGP